MATLWPRSAARSGTWRRAWMVIVAAAVTAVGAARQVGAIDDEPWEPPPVLGCLSKVRGSMWASHTQVMGGQPVTVGWSVNVPSTCTGVTVLASGPGLHSTARSGEQSLVPVPASNGYAMYQLTAYKGGQQQPLNNLAVRVTLRSWSAYGRTTVQIQYDWQVAEFVQAIATPNTTVLLADHLQLDLSGRESVPIERGVHIMGGRSSTKLGPRVFTTTTPRALFTIGRFWNADGVRIVGVRIDGGNYGIAGNPILQTDEIKPVGVWILASVNVEIAHNEIYGWSGVGIMVDDDADDPRRDRIRSDNSTAVWIHDNYIHHNQHYRSEGYGVATGTGAYALIERNVFNYNRHALESSGYGRTGYRAYHNLLLANGGVNANYLLDVLYTHQFDVHGTDSCSGYDAYCGQAGEYYDYRYNTLMYTNGDVLKVRGRPSNGADVTQNVFLKSAGSEAISQTEGDNLLAWNNTFSATESYQAFACDFDGNGVDDDFMATGATWWYKSAATGDQFYYLHTSTKMAHELAFGDVNNDGRCDVTVPAAGTVFYGSHAAGRVDTVTLTAAPQRTDLVWAPPYTGFGTGGQAHLWQMHPMHQYVVDEVPVSLLMATSFGTVGNIAHTGRVLGAGDFNGDGATDLLWHDGGLSTDQLIWVTLLDGSSVFTGHNIVVPGPLVRTAGALSGVSELRGALPGTVQFAGIGDFNADGRADILWRQANGQLLLWFAGERGNSALVNWGNDVHIDPYGMVTPLEAPVSVDWQVQGIGDFNGDGYSDILWRHNGGQVAIWYMVHAMHVGDAYPGGADPYQWEIQGVGDFDGDRHADILWRDVHGILAIWVHGVYDTGLRPAWQNQPGGSVGPEWQVQGIGDFNADGHADILWRSTWGAVSIWRMHGGKYLGESPTLPMDPAWELKGLLLLATQRLDLQ